MLQGPNRFSVRIQARFVHALRELLNRADDRYPHDYAFLRIEPARSGGALLIAGDGHAVAVLHDPQAHAGCAMGVRLPPAFRDACAPRQVVLHGPNGETLGDLPDYLQPGEILLVPEFALLMVAGTHPDFGPRDQPAIAVAHRTESNNFATEDLRYSFALTYDWRAVFRRARAPAHLLHMDPGLYGAFAPLVELETSAAPNWSLEPGHADHASVVRLSSLPNFVGAIMPMQARPVPALPSFLTRELTEA